jgi:hypothetical protein
MSTAFLATVIDTLVPGGALANGVTAPPASKIDAAWDGIAARHAPVLAAIAAEAGGEDAFRSGTEDFRIAALKRVEASQGQVFAALVTAVLTLYYEHPEAIAAFGWTPRPPQPLGHELPPFDESLLAPVKARGDIWRKLE